MNILIILISHKQYILIILNTIEDISELVNDNKTPLLIKLGEATHKIKKKSEQFASNEAINNINNITS